MSSRRALLATAGLLTLAGCLPADDEPRRRPDPDLRLRRRVAGEVRDLAAAYAAVSRAFPATAARLGPLAAEHQAHVVALEGPPASPSASAPSSSHSTSPSAIPAVPATAPAAVSWLAGLERAAADRRARQCLDAGPDLARLLAAVGACEAAHAALLGSGG